MRGNRYRGLSLVAVGALVATIAVPQAAGAQSDRPRPLRFDGEVAFADWFLEDDRNTTVSVFAADGDAHNPPGAPEQVQALGAGVQQFFCDEDTDEWVQRTFFGAEDAPVTIDRRLESASADADVTLFGSELRLPGCASPDVDGGEFADLGAVQATVAADWDGVGQVQRSRGMFHLDTTTFKVRTRGMSTTRDAAAEGVVDVADVVGIPDELGAADVAGLASVKDSSMVIGEEPDPGEAFPPLPPLSPSDDGRRFHGQVAAATWVLDDALNTSVHVHGTDGQTHAASGPPEDTNRVVVSVFQSFCDESTDELVARMLSGSEEDAEEAVDIDRRLEAATAEADVAVSGLEFRTPGCANPDLDSGELRELEPVDASVAVDWEGVGELVRSRSLVHHDAPTFKVRSRNLTKQREAVAHGSLRGLDGLRVPMDLGQADFTALMSVKDATIVIGDAPEPPPPEEP